MKNRLIAVAAVFAIAVIVAPAFAKRSAPKPVAPVTKEGIEYSAGPEGFVLATWVETKREIWRRQIYVIKHEYRFGLEADVQTCFITQLEFAGGKLKVTNERGSEFALDLDTLEVKLLRGETVIDYTNFKPSK